MKEMLVNPLVGNDICPKPKTCPFNHVTQAKCPKTCSSSPKIKCRKTFLSFHDCKRTNR